jgi:hypothetical protein
MSTLECRLDVFQGAERERYAMLRAAIQSGMTTVRELPDGYALGLAAESSLFGQAAEWITLERRCCPFLTLGLTWDADDRVWLRLTGSPDVKTFLGGMLATR